MNTAPYTNRSPVVAGNSSRGPGRIRLGVQRIDDPHHPKGYREQPSPAEMRKLQNRKTGEQYRKCAI